MLGYDKYHQQYESIESHNIYVWPKATRNDTCEILNTSTSTEYKPTVPQTQQNEINSILENSIAEQLKQPRQRLPLKMILSEVARRGDYSHAATIPNRHQQSKSASSIDEILTKSTLMDSEKYRLELLTHPRYLGNKRAKNNIYNVMHPLHKLLDSNEMLGKTQLFVPIINNGSICNNTEDPYTPINKISGSSHNTASPHKFRLPGRICSSKVPQHRIMIPKARHDNKCADQYKCFNYTPFAKSRFQNLYGNICQENTGNTDLNQTKSGLNMTQIKEVSKRISGMQSLCKEKTLLYTPPCTNSHMHFEIEAPVEKKITTDMSPIKKKPNQSDKVFSNKKQNNKRAADWQFNENPYLSSECFFLPTHTNNTKQEHERCREFVWLPKTVETENTEKYILARPVGLNNKQSILKTNRSSLKNKVQFISHPRDEENDESECLTSNYRYELTEYSVTIDSQTEQIKEVPLFKYRQQQPSYFYDNFKH